MRDSRVTAFDLGDDGCVKGVVVNHDFRIRAPIVINAAGVWAAELAKMVGVTIGLYPDRGQILVSEPAPTICPIPMNRVKQVPTGHFHMGTVSEQVGFDLSVTLSAAETIARNAVKMVPLLGELSVIRHYSGLRPMPRDGMPFMGPIPRVPGCYIAVGHSGLTLAPLYGKVFSELIIDGYTDIPIDEYDPLRSEKLKQHPP